MADREECSVPYIEELNVNNFIFSSKEKKTWDFLSKKTGKQVNGKKEWVVPLSREPLGEEVIFIIEDVSCRYGFSVWDNAVSLSFDANEKIQKQFETYIDKPLLGEIFKKKKLLCSPKVQAMATTSDLLMMKYGGLIREGKARDDGSITQPKVVLNCPILKGATPRLHTGRCTVVDKDEKPFDWTAAADTQLKEVYIRLTELVLKSDGSFKLNGEAVKVIIDDTAPKNYRGSKRGNDEDKESGETKRRKVMMDDPEPPKKKK
jgi:hypothetical protein